MTNDLEILDRLKKIESELLELRLEIKNLNPVTKAVSKQLVEDVICPPDFPAGTCPMCEYPKNKCVCTASW